MGGTSARGAAAAHDEAATVVRPHPPVGSLAMRRALGVAGRWSTAAVAATLVVGVVAPAAWAAAPWVPFVVGLVLGIPHGAVDHLVPWWTAARRRTVPRLLVLLIGYVALAATAFVAARAWPTPALLAFLGISAAHFGTGETAVDDLRRGTTTGRSLRALEAAALGSTVLVVPIALWSEDVRPVVLALAPDAGWLLAPAVLVVGVLVVAVLDLVVLVRRALGGRWREAAELVLVLALFVVVPPLAAFGVWFGLWHGLRHLMRLAATDPANTVDLAAGRLARPLRRLALHAAPPAIAVLALLVVLRTVPGLRDQLATGVVASGLALVLALTVPHLVVVAALDRHQLAFRSRPRPGSLQVAVDPAPCPHDRHAHGRD